MVRLKKFEREYESLARKFELYRGGEVLFGLREKEYPVLKKAEKDLKNLRKLYDLYSAVLTRMDEYKSYEWSRVAPGADAPAPVVSNGKVEEKKTLIEEMKTTVEEFSKKCTDMPSYMKEYQAYGDLSLSLKEFEVTMPLLEQLCKPSIKKRHWDEISKLTGTQFDFDKFNELKLKTVLEARLMDKKDDIEEITDSADKQETIERKLRKIQADWDVQSFSFAAHKDRGEVIFTGSCVGDVKEALEESQGTLGQMAIQKQVGFIKHEVVAMQDLLTIVDEVLTRWISVQKLWMALESVFFISGYQTAATYI